MLSLPPRFDGFKFAFPKEFIPKPIREKYDNIFLDDNGVLKSSIDYLNESIQSITFPGISDILITQEQMSHNTIKGDGKIDAEPKTDITYISPKNPLDAIEKQITVTFRLNQGLYNYFMIYETIFYSICKPIDYKPISQLNIDLLSQDGQVISTLSIFDIFINGIDGLNFDYSKVEREADTFNIVLNFNNIDFNLSKKEA